MRPSMEANMAFSVNTFIGDGVTTTFAIAFTNGIYSRDSVHVFVGDELTERAFTWINDGLIEVQGAVPASGEQVVIRRIMDKTNKAVDFADGSILDERNLDTIVNQLYNISHEFLDGYGLSEINTDVDMRGNTLTNVSSDPTDPTSLATIGDIQEAITNPEDLVDVLKKSENLNDVPNKDLAKANLGVVNKNLLINSNFEINNRKSINAGSEFFDFLGSGQVANYACDMWAAASGRTIERVLDDAPSYSPSFRSLRGKISAGSSSTNCQLRTAIETSRSGNDESTQFPVGDTFTLSFGIKNTIGEDYGVYISFRDSVNNSSNVVPIYSNTNVGTGTGDWEAERRSITFTIPSLPGATTTCLEIVFGGPIVAGGNQTTFIQVADVKLERGSVATPYVASDRIEDSAKAARYCLLNATGGAGQHTGYVVTNTQADVMVSSAAIMRVSPTFVTANNAPVLTLRYPNGATDSVEPSSVVTYGGDIKLTLRKVGGGNLSGNVGVCQLVVTNNYILDASL